MIGHRGEGFAEPIRERLAVVRVGSHLVGLVHDHQVPPAPEKALPGIVDARDPRDGGHKLRPVLPGVLAVVGAQHIAVDDVERLAKLVLELALPLEREVGGRDDQRAPHQAAGLELLEQQSRHDGLAGAWIVRQQEPNAG